MKPIRLVLGVLVLLILASISIMLRYTTAGVCIGVLAAVLVYRLLRHRPRRRRYVGLPPAHRVVAAKKYSGGDSISLEDYINNTRTNMAGYVHNADKKTFAGCQVYTHNIGSSEEPHIVMADHARCEAIATLAVAKNTISVVLGYCRTNTVPEEYVLRGIELRLKSDTAQKGWHYPHREFIVMLRNMIDFSSTVARIGQGGIDSSNIQWDDYNEDQKNFLRDSGSDDCAYDDNDDISMSAWYSTARTDKFVALKELLCSFKTYSLRRLFQDGKIFRDISACETVGAIADVVYTIDDEHNYKNRPLQLDICFPRNIILVNHDKSNATRNNVDAPLLLWPNIPTPYTPIGYIMLGFITKGANHYISTGINNVLAEDSSNQGGHEDDHDKDDPFSYKKGARYILYERIHPKIKGSLNASVVANVYANIGTRITCRNVAPRYVVADTTDATAVIPDLIQCLGGMSGDTPQIQPIAPVSASVSVSWETVKTRILQIIGACQAIGIRNIYGHTRSIQCKLPADTKYLHPVLQGADFDLNVGVAYLNNTLRYIKQILVKEPFTEPTRLVLPGNTTTEIANARAYCMKHRHMQMYDILKNPRHPHYNSCLMVACIMHIHAWLHQPYDDFVNTRHAYREMYTSIQNKLKKYSDKHTEICDKIIEILGVFGDTALLVEWAAYRNLNTLDHTRHQYMDYYNRKHNIYKKWQETVVKIYKHFLTSGTVPSDIHKQYGTEPNITITNHASLEESYTLCYKLLAMPIHIPIPIPKELSDTSVGGKVADGTPVP